MGFWLTDSGVVQTFMGTTLWWIQARMMVALLLLWTGSGRGCTLKMKSSLGCTDRCDVGGGIVVGLLIFLVDAG